MLYLIVTRKVIVDKCYKYNEYWPSHCKLILLIYCDYLSFPVHLFHVIS